MTFAHSDTGSASDATLAVDFANTVACEACQVDDALARPRSLADWLRGRTELGVRQVSRDELRQLREFRLRLRELLSAAVDQRRPPQSAIEAINGSLGRFRIHASVDWRRGRWTLREARAAPDRVTRITGPVAASAIRILSGRERGRLCECRGRGCAHFLLARNRTQIWCSPSGCGNRARVARHYWRLRSSPVRGTRPHVPNGISRERISDSAENSTSPMRSRTRRPVRAEKGV